MSGNGSETSPLSVIEKRGKQNRSWSGRKPTVSTWPNHWGLWNVAANEIALCDHLSQDLGLPREPRPIQQWLQTLLQAQGAALNEIP
jgi:hypothetical protein